MATHLKWLKTAALAALGGGIAGIFSAAADPARYSFPHDFGSGKLWKYFFMGASLTLSGVLIKSPLGHDECQEQDHDHEKKD